MLCSNPIKMISLKERKKSQRMELKKLNLNTASFINLWDLKTKIKTFAKRYRRKQTCTQIISSQRICIPTLLLDTPLLSTIKSLISKHHSKEKQKSLVIKFTLDKRMRSTNTQKPGSNQQPCLRTSIWRHLLDLNPANDTY